MTATTEQRVQLLQHLIDHRPISATVLQLATDALQRGVMLDPEELLCQLLGLDPAQLLEHLIGDLT